MGATFLSSRRTIQCLLFFFLFLFLFFYSSKFFVGVMDMDRDFIAIKEELENIASGLRKLVVSEVDSPLESQTSPSSSTEGVGMKRLQDLLDGQTRLAPSLPIRGTAATE